MKYRLTTDPKKTCMAVYLWEPAPEEKPVEPPKPTAIEDELRKGLGRHQTVKMPGKTMSVDQECMFLAEQFKRQGNMSMVVFLERAAQEVRLLGNEAQRNHSRRKNLETDLAKLAEERGRLKAENDALAERMNEHVAARRKIADAIEPGHDLMVSEILDRIRCLAAERDELRKALDEVRQLCAGRYCNLNRDGKTILDFYEVWLRQATERATKAEADRDRLKAAMQHADALDRERDRLNALSLCPNWEGL